MPDDAQQLSAGNDQEQHYADRQVEVLRTHLEAKSQTEAEHTDHQRGQCCSDDRTLPAGG